jgi:hypothetical protein
MAKYLLFISVLFCFSACKKDKLPKGTPECIKDEIEEFKNDCQAIAVKKTIVNGEYHYWFDKAGDPVDRTVIELIFDETCDSVCYFCTGFCAQPWCAEDYVLAEWETIWEK